MVKKFSITVALIFVAFHVHAESVFVEVTGAAGVSPENSSTVEQLLRTSVSKTQGFEVTSSKSESDIVLSAQLLRLEEAYILSADRSTPGGNVTFSERLRANSMDDMDTVADRIVESILFERAAAETADITSVTEEEVDRNTKRIKTIRQFYLGLGPGWSRNLNSGGGGFTWIFGHVWGLDPDYGVTLQATWNDGPGGDDSGYFDASLGVERYITRGANSPIIGAGLGYAHSAVNDQCFIINCPENRRTNGWGVHAKLGYKFFRTSTVNLGLIGAYYYSFRTNRLGNPSMGTVHLVLYY